MIKSAGRTLCLMTVLAVLLVLPATAASADTVDPRTAGPIRVITYNVCGAYTGNPQIPGDVGCRSPLAPADWTRTVTTEMKNWNADVVAFQELCFGQWASLRAALTDYQAVWTSTKLDAGGCGKWATDGDRRFGLGVFVRTSTPVARFVETLRPETDVPPGGEIRSLLCARGPVDGRTTLACTTHLAQQNYGPDMGAGTIIEKMEAWADGSPVILAGDLNARPAEPAALTIRAGGPKIGPFAEVDENDRDYFTDECRVRGATECLSGEPTVHGGTTKFDHIFVSARDFHTVRGDAVETPLYRQRPDHLLLRGAAHPESRTP